MTATTTTARNGAGDATQVRQGTLDARKIGRLFGWFFIGTFVTSIPARILFADGLGGTFENMSFVPGGVSPASMNLAAVLEFGLIVTNVATALVLYPIVKRQSERLALGYVAARIMESAFIAVGLISIMSVLSVSNALVGASSAEAAVLTAQGHTLVSTYEWAFLFGPGLVVGFGNGLTLGYLMYRTGLVPRGMALLGLVGGPMLILSFVLILFGVHENLSPTAFLLTLPEIVWEASLGIYAAWKGFRPAPITKPDFQADAVKARVAVA
jgi:hypothetical protein